MSHETSQPPKRDEPMNPPDPTAELERVGDPDPESVRPPRGYDDPLRRERQSGMITPGHEEPRVPADGAAGPGDRGGAG